MTLLLSFNLDVGIYDMIFRHIWNLKEIMSITMKFLYKYILWEAPYNLNACVKRIIHPSNTLPIHDISSLNI